MPTDSSEGEIEQDTIGESYMSFKEEWDKRTWAGKLELAAITVALVSVFSPALLAEGLVWLCGQIAKVFHPITDRVPSTYKEEYRDDA